MNTTVPTTNTSPHQRIEHVTIIHAPVETVWKDLVNVNDWSWNHWTRLDINTDMPSAGMKGTLRACYEGNDKDWQTFSFEFAEVDSKHHTLAWKGALGCLFSGYHTMRLEAQDNGNTKLIHTEVFGGLLPKLRLPLPYPKLDRNYRLMNESLKKHVEQKQQQ